MTPKRREPRPSREATRTRQSGARACLWRFGAIAFVVLLLVATAVAKRPPVATRRAWRAFIESTSRATM